MAATIDEIVDDLLDSADFEEVSSVGKARTFVTAATRFLLLSPQSQSDQSSSLTMDTATIKDLLNLARLFVSQNEEATTGRSSSVRVIAPSGSFRR